MLAYPILMIPLGVIIILIGLLGYYNVYYTKSIWIKIVKKWLIYKKTFDKTYDFFSTLYCQALSA